MGGSGGGWNSLGNIRALEEKAKAALLGGKRNVFISFSTEDMKEVNLLRGQAKNDNSDIEFNDHSVRAPYNSEQAEYIKRKIAERISRCSTTIIYLSNSAAKSQWVEWEVSKSQELGKRVIAVHSGEKYTGKIPSWINSTIEVIPWSKLSEKLK